jgi:MSHA biogenesis protein MshK
MARLLILLSVLLAAPAQATSPRHDPLRPPAGVQTVPGGAAPVHTEVPQLQAVIHSAQRRIAILNGRSVREGEKIDAWQVLSIRAREVLLDGPGGRRTLQLSFPSTPATPAKLPDPRSQGGQP